MPAPRREKGKKSGRVLPNAATPGGRSGGEREIRTLGTLLEYSRFPGVRNRPLCHLSAKRKTNVVNERPIRNVFPVDVFRVQGCIQLPVAQVSNLLYRRLPVGRALQLLARPRVSRLAGWKPAIQQTGSLRYGELDAALGGPAPCKNPGDFFRKPAMVNL